MTNRLIQFWAKSPVAFRTDKFVFVWFGLIIGCVVFLAVNTILYMSYRIANPAYVNFFMSFFIWWPIFSVVGSILFFHDFWLSFGMAIKNLLTGEKFTWRRPGAVFYGGFLGTLILIALLSLYYKLSFLYSLDFIFGIIPFFHGLSRLGCLNFGCCYGKVCTSSSFMSVQYYNQDSEPVKHGIPAGKNLYPTQLYELLCCICIGFLMQYLTGKVSAGKVFASYVICYGLVRFLLEFVRDNSHEKIVWRNISIWQVLSLCVMAAGIIMLIVLPDAPPLQLNRTPSYINYSLIAILALWNALVTGLTFGIHFRKRGESL